MILTDCLSTKLTNLFTQENDLDNVAYQHNLSRDYRTLEPKTQQEWHSAIASLEVILAQQIKKVKNTPKPEIEGLIISSPTPVINNSALIHSLETVVFSQPHTNNLALMPSSNCEGKDNNFQQYTTYNKQINKNYQNSIYSQPIEIPLSVEDSLKKEQFCLVLTAQFSCLIVKGITEIGVPKFDFSFAPEIVNQAWYLLKERIAKNNPQKLSYLEQLKQKFSPVDPDYRLVSKFSRHLLEFLKIRELNNFQSNIEQNSDRLLSKKAHQIPRKSNNISLQKTPLPPYPEVELLQALTHEIRTPLTTIKTITKLLLKKAQLPAHLTKHLEVIEQECTEQINRMELIFQATELEKTAQKRKQVKLVPISLENILEQTIPCWQKQAQRRNVILDIIVPKKLPQIVSDPAILRQILGGIMEKFTRNLPSGGHFKVLILPAGNQLKLQFLSESNYQHHQTKYLGKLLLFQPDTGSLCLNPDVTKNIFQALGGKLIIKQKPDKGEVLTVFLPLGNNHNLTTTKK